MADLSLIEAVKANDFAETERLIKNGLDVNQQDDQGWTPLNFAAGKGNLSMVELLVKNGAEIFKVGRDRRTPYMIALAAGRVSVVKYLRELEDRYAGEKPERPPRKYCKAYHLEDLRKYPQWSESRVNWKKTRENGNRTDDGAVDEAFTAEKVVFIHQDLTVTESVWHDENVIFNQLGPTWEEFCANELQFRVPDDLDLIVPNESNV